MKLLIVIVGLLFVGLQIDCRAIADSQSNAEACIEELHLDILKIAAKTMRKKLPENDEELINFMGCIGTKEGYISPEGEIVYEELIKSLHEDVEKNPEITPVMLEMFKTIATVAVNLCHQEHVSGTNLGATLIKIKNCVTSQLDELFGGLKLGIITSTENNSI